MREVQAKAALKVLNSYKGGVPSRTSESWTRSNSFRFESSGDRQQIANARDRAYQAYKNNAVARTLVQTETDNVIGDGLNYQPTTDSEEWNREAVDRYYDWLETCSVRGSDIHTGCELQRLLWDRSRVAGDIGWILVNRDYVDPVSGVLTINSKIQVVPSENIVTPDGSYGDRSIYDGIRYDSTGAPTTFYVLATDETGGSRNFIPIGARDFVYLPHLSDVNQPRGQTCYLTIFDLMSHLDRYVDGVSLAAWMATVLGIVFKKNAPGAAMAALPDSLLNGKGTSQKALTMENGSFAYIGTDEEVAQVQAQQPMQQTPEFIRTMYRMLGQPFDMPLEVIAKDMSTCNFASARIGLLPFYRSCRIKAARFGTRWSRTIRWWLSREAQRSSADPKRWDNPFPADYWKHELLVNAWDYTDPVSEAQSDLLQIDMGTKSRRMVISERGRDAEKIKREREEELADMPDEVHSTLTRDPMPAPVAAAAPPTEPPADPVKAYARAYRDILAQRDNGDVKHDDDND